MAQDILFSNIKQGEIFKFCNRIYLKINLITVRGYEINAVDLSSNEGASFREHLFYSIKILKGYLIIEE